MIGKERLGKKRLNYFCCQGDMSSPQCAEDHENQKLWLLFQHSWKLDPWLHFPSGDSKVKLTWQRQTIGKVLVLQTQNSFLSGTPCWTICLTRMTNRSKIQEWQSIWTDTSGHATLATHLSLFRRFRGKKSYCKDFPKTSCIIGGEPRLARQLVFLPAVRNDNQPVQFCHGQSAKCGGRKTFIS